MPKLVSKPIYLLRVLKIVKWLIIAFFVSSILSVLFYKFVPVYYTPLMFIRSCQGGADRQHEWVPYEDISSEMPRAVMASEDSRFLTHYGFDFDAIQAAARHNQRGGTTWGASTISQQTAKNVFLWPGRSWVRKGLEAYFTVLIEFIWGKERIMEVYLNSIEMGDGIYGVEAVAEAKFNKTASMLTAEDCAKIAARLPSPLTRWEEDPTMRRKMRQRTRAIMQNMKFVKEIP